MAPGLWGLCSLYRLQFSESWLVLLSPCGNMQGLIVEIDVPLPILYNSLFWHLQLQFFCLPLRIVDSQATHPSIHSMCVNFRLLPFETKLHIELARKTRCPVPLSALLHTTMSPSRGSS